MGFSFTMEGRNIALESPEQIDTLIEFLQLYKTLTLPKAPISRTQDLEQTPPAITTPTEATPAHAAPTPEKADTSDAPILTANRRPIKPPPGEQAADYIVRVLSNSGVAMDSNDITTAMLAAGWTTQVNGEYKRRHMIDSTLRRKKNQFTQLPDGKWTLVQTTTPQTP